MTIYFAGTEQDAVEGGITISTNSAYFYPLYSNLAVQVSNVVSCGHTLPVEIAAGGTLWVGWSLYSIQGTFPAAMVAIYNGNSQPAVVVNSPVTAGEMRMTLYNTAGGSSYSTLPWVHTLLHHMDLEITTISGQVYARLYRNNLLISETTLAGTGRAMKVVNLSSAISNVGYVSEIIIADEPTLGMRVKTYRPTADGTHTLWAGNFDNVNNDEVGLEAISTQLPNSAETFLHGQPLTEGTTIRALVVGSSIASANPTGASAVLNIGGTLYQKSFEKTLTQGAAPNLAIYETNPATGISFTAADFNSLEFGVQHS